jgi:hypothetical protein
MKKNQNEKDAKRDLGLSTYYDDQLAWKNGNKESRLDALENNLDIEITLSSDNILKMEKLQERYFEDLERASKDDDMGCYIRFKNAYDRVTTLVEARYAPFRPVLDSGKQNV